MESDEGFRLVLFFQGLWVVLCHFFNGTRGLVDDRGSVLDHFGDSRCGSGSSGGWWSGNHFGCSFERSAWLSP